MDLTVTIDLPYLWGDQIFKKDKWGTVNFLVGPNGTGKTLFAEKLKTICQAHGMKPRYLNAERLTGLERRTYHGFSHSQMERGLDIGQFPSYKSWGMDYGLSADAFVILKERIDVRIRIEAVLSQLFGRRIRLVEEGGFLKPKLQHISHGDEYELKEKECHGLKELVTLLTFLYDDEYNCLIIDEPELHLHPQFQTFLLQEIRRIAGDPLVDPTHNKKCFFLITHSPYFVDIRTVEDLKHCIVFHPQRPASYIDQLEAEDEWKIKRFLSRLNANQKQFLFSSHPIFVEGYTDQQIFTLIQEKRGRLLGASGSCIIDVGGKDEMDLFFRLCRKLDIEAAFIADLDTLFNGRLRQSTSYDCRSRDYLQNEGVGVDLMSRIGEMEKAIDECLRGVGVELLKPDVAVSESFPQFCEAFHRIQEARDEDKRPKLRYAFLLALRFISQEIKRLTPTEAERIDFIIGRFGKILEAFRRCGVYLLSRGTLESYLSGYAGNIYLPPGETKKSEAYERERDYLLTVELSEEQFRHRYGELLDILDEASRPVRVDPTLHLSYAIGDWIYKVQSAFARGEVRDKDSLQRNAAIEWSLYSRIMDILEFSLTSEGFECRMRLKVLVDPEEREFRFTNATLPADYRLEPTGTVMA
ncbi:MAG: AAA family ATPase [Firmicutes bacterium]|nr:AAA family ATPase [Bacillota bacterium]